MNNLRETLKSKNFIINENILKNIKKLDINLNEFLLILYFINISNSLDIENISKTLNLNNEEILNTYSSLINKKLIEVVMNNKNGTVDEEISLDLMYDKLLLNFKEETNEQKETDIFVCFEQEFGRSLSPIEYETINNWLEKNYSEETILKALKEAVTSGVNNLRYIDKILYEWAKKGVKTTDYEKTQEFKELFDYNWLEDKSE